MSRVSNSFLSRNKIAFPSLAFVLFFIVFIERGDDDLVGTKNKPALISVCRQTESKSASEWEWHKIFSYL